MTTPPRRVQIGLSTLSTGASFVRMLWMVDDKPPLSIKIGAVSGAVWVEVPDAHAAREYAQAAQGLRDGLVEFAERMEAKANVEAAPGVAGA